MDGRAKQQVIATLLAANRQDLANVIAYHPVNDWYRRSYRLYCVALSMQEAADLLGVQQGASEDEIEKAYKQLAFKHHPDRGGDQDMMVQLNVARDILTGKQRPGHDPGHDTPTSPTWTTTPRTKPQAQHTSFEDAAREAHVPTSGIEWKFKTDTGSGGYGDRSLSLYVVYGKTDQAHIFVGVHHHYDIGNMNAPLDIDEYRMEVVKFPISQELSKVAPKAIRDLWTSMGEEVKGYNAKVKIIPEDMKFVSKLSFMTGRSISFKDAMSMLGEAVPEQWKTGRIDIVFEVIKEDYTAGSTFMFVINGKEHKLSDASNALLSKSRKLLHAIFGDYFYANSKKNLTKMAKAKAILSHMAEKLEPHESTDVIDALKAAAAKAKG